MIGAIEAADKNDLRCRSSWREVRDAEKFVVPTTTPDETMAKVMDWFVAQHRSTPSRHRRRVVWPHRLFYR